MAVYDHLFSVWDLCTGTAPCSVGSGTTKTGFSRPLAVVSVTGTTCLVVLFFQKFINHICSVKPQILSFRQLLLSSTNKKTSQNDLVRLYIISFINK